MSAAGSVRVRDINGWMTIPRNPISRVGVFPYRGAQIGAPDPDRIYRVYRPAEELADPATLESFKLIPWTDGHAMLGDPELQDGLTPPEAKGVHGVIGEQIEYDPNDRTLYGNLKLFSTQLGAKIDAGKKELSLGFRCVYDFTPGVFEGQAYDAVQRIIRGNHNASVDRGRMGPGVAVLDHFNFTMDTEDLQPMKLSLRAKLMNSLGMTDVAAFNKALDEDAPEGDTGGKGGDPTLADVAKTLADVGPMLAKINEAVAAMVPGGAPADMDDMEPMLDAATGLPAMDAAGKPMFQKKKAAPAAGMDSLETTLNTLKASANVLRKKLGANAAPALAAMDEQISNVERELAVSRANGGAMTALAKRMDEADKILKALKPAMDAAPTTAQLVKELAARDALAATVEKHVGTFDHAEMTVSAVAAYACDKFGLKPEKGGEVAAVTAYLHNRPAPRERSGFALDAASYPPPGGKPSAIRSYATGVQAAA